MNRFASLAALLALPCSLFVAGCAATPTAAVLVTQQWAGQYAQRTEAGRVVVRDQPTWVAMWGTLGLGAEPPRIDFGRDMVVGAFAGQKPTGGFGIEVTRVDEDSDAKVYVKQISPPADAITTQALTSPFHLVVVPRVEKMEFVDVK